MPEEVTCQCGTVYERTEVHGWIRGVGQHCCVICDEVLETWRGPVMPVFRLVRMPNATTEEWGRVLLRG
jgi:hypothetical protein